jgi:hypothetical protein
MSIPLSDIVSVTPSVLPAGGNALDLIGLALSPSTRTPINGTDNPVVLQFDSAIAVGDYYGLNSEEYAWASVYFNGILGATTLPGSLLIAQYNQTAVGAFLRGGNVSGNLAILQAVTSGNLEVVVDGFSWHSNSINLSSDNKFSAMAATIQSDLALPGAASFTASIEPGFGNICTMIVTAVASGTLAIGQVIAGAGVPVGTYIYAYETSSGGTGNYAVITVANTTVNSEAMTGSAADVSFTASIANNGTMTVTAIGSGTIQPGMLLVGTNVMAGTGVESYGTGGTTGTGGTGTYKVSIGQVVGSESMTGAPAPITVTYDFTSGGFVVASGIVGQASSIQFATRLLAANMLLTQATGAVTSQGADAADPNGYMNGVIAETTNWFSFTTLFDPDNANGATSTFANKELFSIWTNNQNNRYAYVAIDSDIAPTLIVPCTTCFGYYLQQNNTSGTVPIWSGAYDLSKSALACAYFASLNFEQTNGRANLAFASQSGLTPDVTSQTVRDNLGGNLLSGAPGNGYNCYGLYANAKQTFQFMYPGLISGEFDWCDTYADQVWMNTNFQLDLFVLLTTIKSIPYNAKGNGFIRSALGSTISEAVNYGAIQTGVTLSDEQIADVNNQVQSASGQTVDLTNILFSQGWYLYIGVTPPAVRAARGTPPCTFWWVDGGSVQALNLASVTIQ